MQTPLTQKFLSVEGIEGAGKTTAIKIIQNYLLEHHQDVVVTREPGGTPLAEKIRQLLLTSTDEILVSDAELLLMFAARAQHLANVILPALQAGKWVVSDRFVDASYAYQGGGRKMEMAKIEMLDKWIVHGISPHLTILLDVSKETGFARVKQRGPHDRIEQEKMDFFERVRGVYLSRAKQFPGRFRIIDAEKNQDEVEEELKKILSGVLHG